MRVGSRHSAIFIIALNVHFIAINNNKLHLTHSYECNRLLDKLVEIYMYCFKSVFLVELFYFMPVHDT